MEIILAKSAGFCFGVSRAVEAVEKYLDAGKSVATLGPLIHNPSFIEEIKERGAVIVDDPDELPSGSVLVIRAHGITREMNEKIIEAGMPFTDCTCPFVKKIQNIVSNNTNRENILLIAGDEKHPEVQGFRSYCAGQSFVYKNCDELLKILADNNNFSEKEIISVAQTTFELEEYKNSIKIIKKYCTNRKIFDTICSATASRQEEAAMISCKSDVMIVIGGRISSNTQKLKRVCEVNCKTYLIESAEEIKNIDFGGCRVAGVTAGASTPVRIIKEVLKSMSEITNQADLEPTATESAQPEVENNDLAQSQAEETKSEPEAEETELTFEQALEESLKSLNSDQKVTGVVLNITPTEIQVDIGRKQTGFIPYDEFSADPSCNPAESVKVGDKLDLIIMKTNDVEGTVMLSRKRCEAQENWSNIVDACDNGTVLEGKVVEILAKGVVVYSGGIRIFIPASQATLYRSDKLEDLLNKNVRFKVIEVEKRRRRAVGSIRQVIREERKAAKEAFWAQVEIGQKYTGTVKTLTDFGAFVDIGGVEGLVHRSELSWERIKHPSEVVSVGDVIEVYIKNIDKENSKISLGYRKIEDSPWEILKRDYPVGTICDVQIVSLTTFGAFAQVIPHIQGLIHISQISDKRIDKPQDVLAIGDTVKVMVTAIDAEKKHVSLSMRALIPREEKKPAKDDYDDEPVPISIDDLLAQAEAQNRLNEE